MAFLDRNVDVLQRQYGIKLPLLHPQLLLGRHFLLVLLLLIFGRPRDVPDFVGYLFDLVIEIVRLDAPREVLVLDLDDDLLFSSLHSAW